MRQGTIKKRGLFRRVAVLAAAVVVVCVFINQHSRLQRYNSQIASLEADIAAQQEIGRQLTEKEDVYASKEYIEQVARETLGLVQADEKIYIDSSRK